MNIEKITFPETLYIGVKKTLPMAEIQNKDLYANAYGAILDFIKEKNLDIIGQPVSIYYTWDVDKQETTMAPAIPVKAVAVEADDTVDVLPMSESPAMHGTLVGDYAGLTDAHQAMMDYCEENNITSHTVIEQYTTDPGAEPDSSKWQTDLFYLY